MRMRSVDYLMIALRNITHQRSRSILAIVAIVIGTTSVTILLALVIGAKDFYLDQFKATGKLQQLVVNSQPGLDFQQAQRASDCQDCVKLTDALASKISTYPNVAGLSRTADIASIKTATFDGKSQTIKTVQAYEPNGVIKHVFLAGSDFTANDGAGKVIIGQDYADKWGYDGNYAALIGKQIELTTSSNFTGEGAKLADPAAQFKDCQDGCKVEELSAKQQPTTLKATIVGVESDAGDSIFVPLKWANGLLSNQRYEISKEDQAAYNAAYTAWGAAGQKGAEPMPKFTLVTDKPLSQKGYATFVVKVDDPNQASQVAKQIETLGVGTAIAQSYLSEQLQVFNIISYILAGIGGIALAVAAIGIVNTMVMATLERTREIGVMRAVGARRSTIARLFTLEASLIGFLGGTIGVVVGFGFIMLANFFINGQLAANSVVARNIIMLPPWLVVGVIVFTTLLGMLAGLYPAHRAARLDPVEALRHE